MPTIHVNDLAMCIRNITESKNGFG